MAFRRFTEVSLMIHSEVGVTAHPAPDGESALAPGPRRLSFATRLERMLGDRRGLRFLDILRSFSPTRLDFSPCPIRP